MSSRGVQTQWQLGGSGPEAYERYLVPSIFAPWADDLVRLAAPARGERVLDTACGTGVVARRAAPRVGDGGAVAGVDVSDEMLDVARTVSAGVRPAITWRRGDVMALPFPDDSFDIVFCQQALQFMPDPVAALAEMRRVLDPEGRVAVAVWRDLPHNPVYGPLANALERHVGADAATFTRAPFPSWNREILRDMFRDAGFRDVYVRLDVKPARFPSAEEFLWQEAASSPASEALGALPADTREALTRDVAHAVRDYVDDDGVVFPMESHVILAQS